MTRKKTTKAAAMSAAAAMNDKRGDEDEGGGRREHHAGRWSPTRVILVVVSVGLAFLKCATYFPGDLPSASTIFGPPPDAITNLSMTDIAASLSTGFDEFYAANVQPLLDMGARGLDGVAHAAEEGSRVGHQLRIRNARAKHPVVLIPGFTSSGLELWEGRACLKQHFRQRVWGSAAMAKAFLADSECWRRHLMLDPRSGTDPENIRVRAAQGFEAADNFVGSFWVWGKIIENLADVGYDGSTMTMMSYDWRLGFEHLERRDGYFTKLRHAIEGHLATTGRKAVIVSHSMGGLVSYYFFQWVVSDAKLGGGGAGEDWIENHVHAFVNIAGPMLGVPKAIPALLSGELKDTAVMFPQLGDILEKFFGRKWRRNLWSTWGSLFGMLPKGGDAIWDVGADLIGEGVATEVNDDAIAKDEARASSTTRTLLVPAIVWHNGTDEICPAGTAPSDENPLGPHALNIHPSRTWSVSAAIEYLLRNDGGGSSSIYSFDSRKGWKTRSSSVDKRLYWHDPLATKLPKAPSLNIYCLYGVGIETERSYYYKVSCDRIGNASGVDGGQVCPPGENEDETHQCGNMPNPNDDEPPESPFYIDTAAKDYSRNVHSGVRFSDGDATVPLLSLGYMCQKWAQPGKNPHNPSGVGVYTRERRHESRVSLSDPGRAGPMAGEHVDILGNVGVIEDVVRIATGFEVDEKVNEDIIVSDLRRIVEAIDGHQLGGSRSVFE